MPTLKTLTHIIVNVYVLIYLGAFFYKNCIIVVWSNGVPVLQIVKYRIMLGEDALQMDKKNVHRWCVLKQIISHE